MARTKSCSSPGWSMAMLALVIVTFLIVSVLCQMVTRHTPYSNRTAPETFVNKKATANLIYVYMDGCGHCKQFDPTWTAFTRKYSDALDKAGVSARKVKSDDAGVKDLGIRGFPTVVLLSSTNDFPQKTFEGDRSVSGLTSFVQDSIPSFAP